MFIEGGSNTFLSSVLLAHCTRAFNFPSIDGSWFLHKISTLSFFRSLLHFPHFQVLILLTSLSTKVAQGRPKKTWMEVIRQDIEAKGLNKTYCSIGMSGES